MKTFLTVSSETSGETETTRRNGTGQPREPMCSGRRFWRRARMSGRGMCRVKFQAPSTSFSGEVQAGERHARPYLCNCREGKAYRHSQWARAGSA